MRVGRLFTGSLLAVAAVAACVNFDGLSAQVDARTNEGGGDGTPGIPLGDIVLRGTSQGGPVPAEVDIELSPPPETRAGDLMVLAMFNDRQDPDTAFARVDASLGNGLGWKQALRLAPSCGAGYFTGIKVFTKVATSSEQTIYVDYDHSDPRDDMASALLSVWGGVDPQGPVEATMFVAPGDTLDAPSVTTAGPGRVLLVLFSNKNGAGASWIAPPGMTQRASTGHLALFTELLPNAGDTGPRVAQTNRPVCGAASISLALRPAPR